MKQNTTDSMPTGRLAARGIEMTTEHTTPKRSTTFYPAATPLYAAFANALWSEDSAAAGIIIGWERTTCEEGDRNWTFTEPVIVPFGLSGPVLDGDDFWDYIGAAIEVYPTIEDAKAAVPKMTKRLCEDLRKHHERERAKAA